MSKCTLRLAQLDLARQMETTQYIRDFIDFAARCGYNGIMLLFCPSVNRNFGTNH